MLSAVFSVCYVQSLVCLMRNIYCLWLAAKAARVALMRHGQTRSTIERPSADAADPNPEHVTHTPDRLQVKSGGAGHHVINLFSMHTLSGQLECLERSWRVPGVSLWGLQGLWRFWGAGHGGPLAGPRRSLGSSEWLNRLAVSFPVDVG